MVYLPYKPGCCSRQTVSSLARLGLPQQTAQPRVDCPPPCRQVLQTPRQRPSMLTYNLTDSHLRESWKYQRDLSCRPGQVSLSVFHVCRKISVCNTVDCCIRASIKRKLCTHTNNLCQVGCPHETACSNALTKTHSQCGHPTCFETPCHKRFETFHFLKNQEQLVDVQVIVPSATPKEVAHCTTQTMLRGVPAAVPGIQFLSGQSMSMSEGEEATFNLQVTVSFIHFHKCFRTFGYLCLTLSVYWSNGHGWPQRP